MSFPVTTESAGAIAAARMEHREAVCATRKLTRPALMRDVIVVVTAFIATFLVAGRVNAFEAFVSFVRTREDSQLDEVIVALAVLSLVLVVLMSIRWREMRSALVRSIISERATITARAAADAANQAKSEFLANMSHEIRTPMNGIVGMTELALGTDLSDEQRSYIETVRTSADALLTLINDILDFSKIEARKLDIDLVDFDLSHILDETMQLLAPSAHAKGLELAYHVAPDVEPALGGDPARLRQIILNLAGNAIKFTAAGEVVLRVDRESHAGDHSMLHFTITDTGVGIAPEKQATIFDAFTQADMSTTRRFGGTGLGLAIASQLVKLMGGRIWVESEPGRGSAFHFTLLVQVRTGAPAKPARGNMADLRGMTVLVVDDNATNRRILDEVLTHWGMQPTIVDSGHAALLAMEHAQASGTPFTFALIDFQMPDFDGFQLADAILRRPELGTPTIMMLSSVGQTADAVRCRELGVAAYLTKPVRQSVLLDAMLEILASRSQHAPVVAAVPARSAASVHHPRRVLVAEDNAVNRLVVTTILKKHGHAVVTVENGTQAVAAVHRGAFDVVLMDVQMPEMDGLEATAAIRAAERGTERHLPIIALTAHAMKGDREACAAAGMDAYLSKPVHPAALLAAIAAATSHLVAPAVGETVVSTFDRADVLARVEGDLELLNELTVMFREDSVRMLGEMNQAVETSDGRKLERIAHSLKSAAASLGGSAVTRTAVALETMGRDNRLAGGAVLVETLGRELGSLDLSLTELCRSPSA